MPKPVHCGKEGCNPRRVSREGHDHVGIDVLVKCAKCNLEGPYIECWDATDDIRRKVTLAWNDDMVAIAEGKRASQ